MAGRMAGAGVLAWLVVLSVCMCGMAPLVVMCCRAARARQRARVLLRELLTEAEHEQLMRCQYLEIASPGIADRIYRIPRAGGRVRVYDHGAPVMDLCVQPTTPLPPGDIVLLHKLLIETSEETYLATANRFSPKLGWRVPPLLFP